ncbi:MAG: phosphoheptose isomerase [Lewinellaceae bacterium]|nr:phosphoheptose isomerase [Lewinellaceae bacterium]
MSQNVFHEVAADLAKHGFKVVDSDFSRPWGGFFVIDESQIKAFAQQYFPHLADTLPEDQKMSPKILVVAPQKRLSWQYHFRRAEVWRVIEGPVAVAQSETDEETTPMQFENGDFITLRQGERHRLIGLGNYGIVAEIWQHTDPQHPSDESDIVRVQDDFQRK